MNNTQISLGMLTDSNCSCLLILVFAIVMSLSICFVTCKVIRYLKDKHELEAQIENRIFRDDQVDELKITLANMEKEINQIKILLNNKNIANKRKCFLSRLLDFLCRKK